MLDPKYIREHAEEVKANCLNRNVKLDVDAWLATDGERLGLMREVEELRAARNSVAEKMKNATAEERPALIETGKSLKDDISVKESALESVDAAWKQGLMAFPNLTHPDSPVALTEDGSVEVRVVGEVTKLDDPLDHVALAEKYDLIDFNRGAKVAGAKFYFLKNQAAILEQALTRYAFEYLTKEGFIPISTPDVARDEVLLGTGYQPRGPETQIYSLEGTDLSLVGTAEIPLGGYHKDEVLDYASLPLKYVGLSHCFRTEAGSYGKESYGLYRVHQFTKIEMFVFCTPDQSEALHAELLRHEENLFKSLNIPFRVLDICSGDLGGPAYRKYDLEAWMWGRNDGKGDWGEVTSASNCTDFQARRLNVRFKNEQGNLEYAHTLNGTAFAISRALIALLENNQRPDGTIEIPTPLIPYCGFSKIG
ncbi:serine--tRNA ligase [Candidatus Uhrbacteria bacterium]|nr:serine--tRNA ligase [Candidatus Uhrbacteria bacterium]